MVGTDAPDEPDCTAEDASIYCCVSIYVSFTIWSLLWADVFWKISRKPCGGVFPVAS